MKIIVTVGLVIGLSIGLIACSVDSDQSTTSDTAPTTSDPGTSNPPATSTMPQSGRSLDLRLPASKISEQELTEKLLAAQQEKLPDLFEKKNKEQRIKVDGKPSFIPGEGLTDTPTIDGAEMSIEVKID